jgi:MFS family permease
LVLFFKKEQSALTGLSATLVGIGLARFAYSALIPALVGAGWFAPAQAAYLGAANLAGYLAGVVLARSLAGRLPAAGLLRGMMLLVGVAFLACAVRFPFGWFFAWRFAAGFAGGVIMARWCWRERRRPGGGGSAGSCSPASGSASRRPGH